MHKAALLRKWLFETPKSPLIAKHVSLEVFSETEISLAPSISNALFPGRSASSTAEEEEETAEEEGIAATTATGAAGVVF